MVARRHRRRRPRRASKVDQPTRRRRWPWLGLGAILIALGTLLRREPRPAPPPQSPAPPPRKPQPPSDIESCWLSGPTGTIHVLERHPDGKLPVVFVHGLGGRANHWTTQFAAAGPAIRAVAFDLPGHGRSDLATDGDYSISANATAIGAVADGLGLRRMILVAHSLGATAAIEYAGRHRQRVAGLLLVDPSGDQTRLPEAHHQRLRNQLSKDPEEEIRWSFQQLLAGATQDVTDQVLKDLAEVPTEVQLGVLASGLEYSPMPALERYDGPVRSIVSSLNDLPYSLHRLIPTLRCDHLPGASHWLMLDRADELWTTLIELLDEVETRRRESQPHGSRSR